MNAPSSASPALSAPKAWRYGAGCCDHRIAVGSPPSAKTEARFVTVTPIGRALNRDSSGSRWPLTKTRRVAIGRRTESAETVERLGVDRAAGCGRERHLEDRLEPRVTPVLILGGRETVVHRPLARLQPETCVPGGVSFGCRDSCQKFPDSIDGTVDNVVMVHLPLVNSPALVEGALESTADRGPYNRALRGLRQALCPPSARSGPRRGHGRGRGRCSRAGAGGG